MNDVAIISAVVEAQSADEKRAKALARFETQMRELAVSPPLERVAAIDKELDLIEQYARDTGLFRDHEMLEFRIGRLVTRWHLGERLAKIERVEGPGPGRGKKGTRSRGGFWGLVDRLKIGDEAAIDAQRIACMPWKDALAYRDEARARPDLRTFAAALAYARRWWSKERRKQKLEAVGEAAAFSRRYPISRKELLSAA